ncbi:hypothetical protein C9374_000052 [Naegleria lovaniensis]|uniref:Uncharacterized protein n=1 Tax=Naegleria lovaniensis TaxID=51637 RepID=A0AA88KNK4_NAELO|nr:uncharacterized protein C9374_000052 [Naegleria lovaniensis]KAG2388613.1 hypothetical protein C9374_000052 [Naegleria lovaniensis]
MGLLEDSTPRCEGMGLIILIINFLFPGFGTIIAAFITSEKEKMQPTLIVGILQLFLSWLLIEREHQFSSDPQAVVNDENAPPVKKALSQTFNPSQKTSQARKSSVLQPLNRNVQEIPPSNSEPKVSKVPPLKRTNSASNIPSQSISRAHHESAKKINLTKLKGASSYRKRPLVEKTIMYKTLEEIATSSVPKFHLHKKTHLLKSIHDNIFGSETFFKTPFGLDKFLPFVYCDTVQEGKPLKFIEDYLHEQVLPTFGNPNARTNSFLSYQSSQFVTDARAMIAKSLNANIENISNETKPSDTDAMFFTRNSCADAIRLFCDRIGLSAICKSVKLEKERPVILVSPNEHKENIQAWKETGSELFSLLTTSMEIS